MAPTPARTIGGSVLCGLAALLLLATCGEPADPDYTQRHPIGVQPETVSMPASYAGSADPFAGEGAERLDTLVEGYLDRGHGLLTIAGNATTAEASVTANARMATLRRRLIAAGVPASDIVEQLGAEGEPDTVTVSYERYTAVLPACGDWSKEMAFNPYNTDYPGFGCAQQHNLGAMLADPADLLGMRPMQPADSLTTERVLDSARGNPAAETTRSTERTQNAIESTQDQNAASGTTSFSSTSTR